MVNGWRKPAGFWPTPAGLRRPFAHKVNVPFSKRRATMARRWVCAGVLAVLMAAVARMPLAGARETSLPKEGNSVAAGKVLVSDVIIQGNRRMTAEQIKVRLRTQASKEYNPSTVDEDVRELYKTQQFSNIRTLVQEDGPGKVKIFFLFLDMRNPIQKITFQGAKHIKEEYLRNLTGLRLGGPLNPNLNKLGCQKILEEYEERGRPFAQCTLVKGSDANDTEVLYRITEGPKAKVRDIQFTGNTFINSARLTRKMHSSSQWSASLGGTYNKKMADRDVRELIAFYRASGYPDVRVSLETQKSSNGCEATLIFHIQEGLRHRNQDATPTIGAVTQPSEQCDVLLSCKAGPFLDQRRSEEPSSVRIGQILVSGNKRISSESIRAHIPLSPGQVLTSSDLRQAEKMLAELGLFVVDPTTGIHPTIAVVDSEDDSAVKDIRILVKEKKAKRTSFKAP
jgi:outer membrane protein assembly factor BamA